MASSSCSPWRPRGTPPSPLGTGTVRGFPTGSWGKTFVSAGGCLRSAHWESCDPVALTRGGPALHPVCPGFLSPHGLSEDRGWPLRPVTVDDARRSFSPWNQTEQGARRRPCESSGHCAVTLGENPPDKPPVPLPGLRDPGPQAEQGATFLFRDGPAPGRTRAPRGLGCGRPVAARSFPEGCSDAPRLHVGARRRRRRASRAGRGRGRRQGPAPPLCHLWFSRRRGYTVQML